MLLDLNESLSAALAEPPPVDALALRRASMHDKRKFASRRRNTPLDADVFRQCAQFRGII